MKKYKYCPTCGAEYDAVAKEWKCTKCDAKLVAVSLKKPPKQKRIIIYIECLVILAMIVFIASLYISTLLETYPGAQNAACATLRAIRASQELYAEKWGVFGTAFQLGPDGQRLIDGHMSQMTRDISMEQSGYYFRMDCAPDGSGWCAICWPVTWGTTGEKAYRISAEGYIKWKDEEGTNPDWNPENYPKYLGER